MSETKILCSDSLDTMIYTIVSIVCQNIMAQIVCQNIMAKSYVMIYSDSNIHCIEYSDTMIYIIVYIYNTKNVR